MCILPWIIVAILSFAKNIDAQRGVGQNGRYIDYDVDDSEPNADDDSDDCICVPFYRCEDGVITEDGAEDIKPRGLLPSEYLTVNNGKQYTDCERNHVCCRRPDSVRPTVSQPNHKCGRKNPISMNGRIMNAQASGKSEFGEWPWQAAILKPRGPEYLFLCGGTLIDEQHVLTAAHCVTEFMNNEKELAVRLGEWDTQVTTESFPHETFNVSEVIIHPGYRSSNYYNDIAILRLEKKVTFKPHIDVACLPRDEDSFTGQTCIVTGWGRDAFENGSFSRVMKKVALPVVGHSECQTKLRNTILGPRFKLHGGFLCAGGKEGEDACTGDGGGPLVCYQPDDTYTLVGIVSWGLECGTRDVPGVYVSVQNYINWISSVTGKPVEQYWSDD